MNVNNQVLCFIIFSCLTAAGSKTEHNSNSTGFKDTVAFSLDKYAYIKPVRDVPNTSVAGWQNYFYSKSDLRCVYGGEYFIAVRDKFPDSQYLTITLQGGGACWPGLEQCKEAVNKRDVKEGWVADNIGESLKQNWNGMVVPYCDGSLYMGDRAADYDEDGNVDHWHWGLRASTAAVELALEKFPDLEKILITGCSAGGYGTFIFTRLVRDRYPNAKIYVLNESGPGLFNPVDEETWNSIKDTWKLDQLLQLDSRSYNGEFIYLYDELMAHDPNLKIGLFSSYEDEVLANDFLMMSPEDFRSLLVTCTGHLNEKYPHQFKRFFINGDTHCVVDRNYTIRDTQYADWVLQLMSDDDSWRDLLE